MTDPLFQQPTPAQPDEKIRHAKRRYGRGNAYTENGMIRRYKHLDREGRRCVGNNSKCLQAATKALMVIELDPVTLERTAASKPHEVKVCSQHAVIYLRGARFVVEAETRIQAPPR